MREIGNMIIPETGSEAFELACRKAKHTYRVSRSIAGYFCLYRDLDLIHETLFARMYTMKTRPIISLPS